MKFQAPELDVYDQYFLLTCLNLYIKEMRGNAIKS